MTTPRVTIHMIGQAHLDPVWLWGWQAGLDEVLATCRTACDLLDDYPDFIFTRAEAWSYQQIERLDPALFARIRALVAGRRWEIVGGWWLQPDCNFPSGVGFERQIAVGKRYLLDRFGIFPEIGYNVDSFGHAATLPGMMAAAGQRAYVMMRPQEHELTLPARVFRWRGYPEGAEVTTFRIAGSYGSGPHALDEGHIRRTLEALPAGLTHTMCFYGVGDHGGGPTARLIEWITDHQEAFDGCRLEFSSPSRFFAAIAAQIPTLPLVTGELQHHAIGCYSVQRAIKTGVRSAEHRLRQAETLPDAAPETLEPAWQQVSFAQFHDILGGTCIPSAYPPVYDMLATARHTAEETLQYRLRDQLRTLPNDPRQRLVLYNASDDGYNGYAEMEPWTQWRTWQSGWRLLDAGGQVVPYQLLPSESVAFGIARLLYRACLAPGALEVRYIDTGDHPTPVLPNLPASDEWLANSTGVSVDVSAAGWMQFPDGTTVLLPRLALIGDLSDNWSHGIDRYPSGPVVSPVWNAPTLLHHGPLMSALLHTGTIGDSTLRAEWRVYADLPFIELRLDVHWREQRKLLKLVCPLTGAPVQREDGIPGGSLLREQDGKERPLQDWTRTATMGVVCPDVFALDGTPARLRFTLLRAAIMAHHEPNLGMSPTAVFTDQGVHHFRFRFYGAEHATPARLTADSLALHRPLITAEMTRGMTRW